MAPSGDGGNRTRVRKNRPAEIYERSRSKRSSQATRPTHFAHDQPLVFCPGRGTPDSTPRLSRPSLSLAESGAGGRGLTKKTGLSGRSLMQRGAWQRRKCDWHLRFCAEFTSSAPLGSHSGTSLLRRSLSSPGDGMLPIAFIISRPIVGKLAGSPSLC